jgi:predicted lipoprotein with Yx(FWY)xxD motif
LTLTLAALAATALLGACGGDDGGDSAATAASGSGAGAVSVANVDGVGDVLVDSDGRALYTSDQERDGKVRCTGPCTSIWLPLDVPAGAGQPTAGSGVPGQLDVVKRPDGSRQVTHDGAPIYRFAEDGGAGTVTGNGVADSFGGQRFSWHVLRVGGGGGDDQESKPPSSGGGY